MARSIVILILISIAVPALARAQCTEEQAAADCCRQIIQSAVEIKYQPDCLSPAHKTPVTFTPCMELCVDAPCHKPLMTMYPCGSFCSEEACHRPALTAEPCGECGSSIELTGCRCQIEHRECDTGCDCDSCH